MTATATVLDTFSAIEARRSVKHYDPTHVMTPDEIQKLMQLTLLSPTSFNIQNWRFVVCDRSNSTLREQLCEASWNQAQVKEAALLVAVCADLKAWSKQPERYWRNAPENVQQMIVPMIGQLYANNPDKEMAEALRSGGIAAQTLMLAAKAMGYDTCPMVGFMPDKVAELIKLPEDHTIVMLISVGRAAKPANERSGSIPMEEAVFYNQFS